MSLEDGVLAYDDGTASNDAFKKTFRVGVQNKFLKTPELVHWLGVATTGNRTLDKQLQENFVEILATPIACVEYYLMGAPIRFRNAAIPYEILKILRQHVRNWDYILNTSYNAVPPPAEELDDIMSFCDLIIKYAGAGKRRDQSWLIGGRIKSTNGSNAYIPDAIGSRRRKLETSEATHEVRSSEDIRADKLKNFHRNFSKLRPKGT